MSEIKALLKLYADFYDTWARCESTRGCYSCCEQHDCRCPKAFAKKGKCECGRDKIEALEVEILETRKFMGELC